MQVFFVDNTSLSAVEHSLNDLQFKYYSDRSGLTPIWQYSLTDHMRKFFESLLGSSPHTSVDDLEQAYYRLEGAVGSSYDDVKYDFYTNRSGGIIFITDHGNGTGYANILLAPLTDHSNGTGFIGLPATITDHSNGTGYGFI